MYTRYPNYRFSGGVRVPNNYSGNAFRQSEPPPDEPIREVSKEELRDEPEELTEPTPESEELTEKRDIPVALPLSSLPQKKQDAPRLSLGRSLLGLIGSEELLLLALIFILSSSEVQDDTVLFLILLLFVS
ncbi:MAG: hypothetical protein E7641_08590 [Ruminococcaceae bacterium]|nr:hypothetical protein [Oscillospiraceae bacterium]